MACCAHCSLSLYHIDRSFNAAEMDIFPINTDVLLYIDVTPPYFALKNLSLLPSSSSEFPAVSGTFSREQPPPPCNANSFCGSELGRHAAILGSVAAAYSNPIKAKHYYLALDALAIFEHCPTSQELRAEAHITSATWEKRRVDCEIQVFTLQGRYAGKMNVSYAIMSEVKLLKMARPIDAGRVYGTAWQLGEPSPYEDPIMLRMVKTHTQNLATAIISLHDKRSMAGHFSPIPAAPIAILSSNGLVLCRRLLGEGEGKQWLDRRTRVRCQRLAVAGEILEVQARKLEGREFSHRVEFWDEDGKLMGSIDYLLEELGDDGVRSKL